jgi:hypothetical protein
METFYNAVTRVVMTFTMFGKKPASVTRSCVGNDNWDDWDLVESSKSVAASIACEDYEDRAETAKHYQAYATAKTAAGKLQIDAIKAEATAKIAVATSEDEIAAIIAESDAKIDAINRKIEHECWLAEEIAKIAKEAEIVAMEAIKANLDEEAERNATTMQ